MKKSLEILNSMSLEEQVKTFGKIKKKASNEMISVERLNDDVRRT